MAAYSFGVTGQLVLNTILAKRGWPVWYILTTVSCLMLLTFSIIFFARKMPWPEPWQVKWVILRSFCVTLSYLFSFVAVHATGAVGDVNALTSINVVAASTLGHVFLNERLRLVHVSAVLCSLVGAAFIARPAFLFGDPKGDGASLFFGYTFALAAGFVRAMAFVSARKYGQVSIVYNSSWVMAMNAVLFAALPLTPLAEEESLKLVVESPWLAAACVAVNAALVVACLASGILGSMLCPAAVSATVFTASGMVAGYFAQSVIFRSAPDLLSLLGALLMFFAVVLMTFFRVRPSEANVAADGSGQNAEEGHLSIEENVPGGFQEAGHLPIGDDGTESLFEFAASEFADFEPHSETLRLRRQGAAADSVGAQVIGVAAATAMNTIMPIVSQ